MVERREQHGPDPALLDALGAAVVFLWAIQASTLATSIARVPLSPWLSRLILLASAMLGLLVWRVLSAHADNTQFRPRPGASYNLLLAFLVFAALVYAALWLSAYVVPDLSSDGNMYHIPTISLWSSKGYIHWVDTVYMNPLINGYPKGVELLAYVATQAGDSNLINTATLFYLPIGVLGIAVLASLLGASMPLALSAGAAYLLIPVNIFQSQTTYVDTAYASCAIAFTALLISPHKKGPLAVPSALFLAMATALALGAKATGVLMVTVGFLALLARSAISALRNRTLQAETAQTSPRTGPGVVALLLIMAFLTLPGAYWYLRNFLETGSPFFPAGLNILGRSLFPGATVSEAIYAAEMVPLEMRPLSQVGRILYAWAQGTTQWPGSLNEGGAGYESRLAGLGFLWLIVCLPALAISVLHSVRNAAPAPATLWLLVAIVTTVFVATPNNWWSRYTVWIYALGLPCAAYLISFLHRTFAAGNRITRSYIFLYLATCLAVVLFEGLFSLYSVVASASPASVRSDPISVFSPATWRWPTSYLFPEWRGTALDRLLAETATVAIGPRGNVELWHYSGMVAQLAQPIGDRQLVFLDPEFDIAAQTRASHAQYVVWDPTFPLSPPWDPSKAKRAGEYLVFALAGE